MKRALAIIATALLFCIEANCMETHHFYVAYSGSQGLYDTNITNCCQDRYGRLWVASSEGVYIYTGNKFTIFNNSEYKERCSKMTDKVAVDGDGCLWILSNTGIGYYDPDSNRFKIVDIEIHGRTWDISFDSEGGVWLAVGTKILRYDKSNESVQTILTKTSDVNELCINGSNLYFTDSDGGILSYSIKSAKIEPIKSPFEDEKGNKIRYEGLAFIDGGHILTSTSNGKIVVVDLDKGKERVVIDYSSEEIIPHVLTLMVRGNEYWIGTQTGAFIYDAQTGETERQIYGEGGKLSLVGQYVRDFFTDRDGNVWASTLTGLKGWINYGSNFERFVFDGTENSPAGTSVCAAIEGPDGNIWFGSDEGKIFTFNPRTKAFEDYTEKIGIPDFSAIDDIKFKDNLLFVISYGYGLTVYDISTGKVVRRLFSSTFKNISPLKGSGFKAYIGSTDGLYLLDGLHSTPVRLEGVPHKMITDVSDAFDDKCWIATYGGGFGIIDTNTNTYISYDTKSYPSLVKTDYITTIRVCHDGTVWAGTDGEGLLRLYMEGDKVTDVEYVGVDNGLPFNNVRAICFGGSDIWTSTPNGICQISKQNLNIIGVYLQSDAIVGSHFNEKTGFLASNGKMYFGTSQGIVAFDPDTMTELFSGKKVMINNVTVGKLDNRKTTTEKGKSVIASKSLRVKQKDAPVVAFSFSTMLYGNPNLVNYKCTLKGRNFENITTTTENPITYLGLAPGKYDFTVEVNEGTSMAHSDSKRITIVAPWYMSVIAQMIYWIAFISLIGLGTFAVNQRKNKRFLNEAKMNEDMRQKKLLQEKIDFMTNITHEIRTPISVISILVEKMFGKDEHISADASALKMNVGRIVQLCNELLDLRKIQDGEMSLNKKPEDIGKILISMCTPYETVTKEKGIHMELSIPDTPVMVNCDKESMDIILSNLLSNAMKYCTSKIDVGLISKDGTASIRISSDGKKIPDYEQERIFDAFYQSKHIDNKGTGIGLTFSRALAQKNGGRLFLDGEVEEMNSFVAEFPVCVGKPEEQKQANLEENKEDQDTDTHAESYSEETCFLVVEDNDYLRKLIAEELSKNRHVLTACNGTEAIRLIKENNVELVISDIMMPEMDGCELCNIIKSSVEYSHISVILLTAAVGIETQMRSLKSGADCYLEKPFNMDVLMTAIENIQINRRIHNNQFMASPLAKIEVPVSGGTEQELMNRLHDVVIEHIGDTEMTTTELANLVKIPRKVLIQKLKVNTGLSINEYIRICRLKKAAELLAENKYMVKEVAYYVGYTSSSYFAKHFTAQFGISPSEFAQQNTSSIIK
ncbi:MAG: response regulator [Bacteroidales bacterium]|nr:response regulator [Candidatus Cryptobacteroides caccocaballi]